MDFVQDNPGEPVPEETFTYSHLSIVPYLLHPSKTIHGILPVQSTRLTVFFSTISLQVFFGLPLGLAPSTSYSIPVHFFTQSLSSFHNTCPYHRNLFCCSTDYRDYVIALSNRNTYIYITVNSNSKCPLLLPSRPGAKSVWPKRAHYLRRN